MLRFVGCILLNQLGVKVQQSFSRFMEINDGKSHYKDFLPMSCYVAFYLLIYITNACEIKCYYFSLYIDHTITIKFWEF